MARVFLLLIYLFCNISHAIADKPRFSLLNATKLGSKKLVVSALAKHDNPDQQDEFGNTALHYAAHMQNRTITDILLAWHANPNIQNKKGQTPIALAAQTNNDYITRRLLLYGAHAQLQDLDGNTPLHIAATRADQEAAADIASHLIAHTNIDLKNNNKETAFMIAMQVKQKHQSSSNRKKMNIDNFIKQLSRSGAKQNRIHLLNKHYIQCAKTNNLKAMQKISSYRTIEKNLQHGKYQRTALMYAAYNNRTAMVDYLVNHLHVDKTIKDYYGKTAFDYAQKHKNSKLNELLIIT